MESFITGVFNWIFLRLLIDFCENKGTPRDDYSGFELSFQDLQTCVKLALLYLIV